MVRAFEWIVLAMLSVLRGAVAHDTQPLSCTKQGCLLVRYRIIRYPTSRQVGVAHIASKATFWVKFVLAGWVYALLNDNLEPRMTTVKAECHSE
ncbi:hypothetical protein B1A74_11840 [Thioalkalivibrio halophilus]|uniref:Secreted protein n=1 Tax=Thioalkalivibrio halophilus TaxID=252474 RepID=A0A1V2ZVS8_9GAMM|nr:hypothetical protein B1A74_11840 [Thioalkalivibrio halophilus]